MAETRWEWGVVYGVDTTDLTSPVEGNFLGYDDEAEAREMLQWLRDSMVVRRRVTVGPWEPAAAEDGGDAARHATGTVPADAEWGRAQLAFDAAERSLAAEPEAKVPQPVRDAVAALGDLLGVWQGYGESEATDWDDDD